MPTKDYDEGAFDWDKGLQQLNQNIDAKQIHFQAEMLAKLEAEYGFRETTQHSSAVRGFLSTNENLIRSAINVMLLDFNTNIGTYEYRGDFMTIGISENSAFSYSASYFPSISDKAGKIYVTINSLAENCETVASNVLPLRPPSTEN